MPYFKICVIVSRSTFVIVEAENPEQAEAVANKIPFKMPPDYLDYQEWSDWEIDFGRDEGGKPEVERITAKDVLESRKPIFYKTKEE